MNVGDGLSNSVEHENRIEAQIIIFEKLIDTFDWIYLCDSQTVKIIYIFER